MSKLQAKFLDALHNSNKKAGKYSNVWGGANLRRAAFEFSDLESCKALGYPGELVFKYHQPCEVRGSAKTRNPQFLRFDPNVCVSIKDSDVELRLLEKVSIVNFMDFHLCFDGGGLQSHASSVIWPVIASGFPNLDLRDISIPTVEQNPSAKMDVAFLLASDVPPHNYCHFVADTLPRLSFLHEFGYSEVCIISPVLGGGAYETQFIDLIKSPKVNWLTLSHGEIISVKKLFYIQTPGPTHPFFNCSDWAIKYVRSLIPELFYKNDFPKDFLLIDRSRRRMKNMSELCEQIGKVGSYTYIDALEKYNIIEQIKLFQDHRHIVGCHGAALTNIAFRSVFPSKVTEIVSSGNGMATFSRIAHKLGVDHGVFGCDSIPSNHPNYPDCCPDVASRVDFIQR